MKCLLSQHFSYYPLIEMHEETALMGEDSDEAEASEDDESDCNQREEGKKKKKEEQQSDEMIDL